MGAGSFGAGIGPMGLDPVAEASPPRNAKPPAALWWDAGTRDYLRDDNGFFLSLHPVDQKMAIALTHALGTNTSVPKHGARFPEIRYAGGPALGNKIADMAKQATAATVNAGEAKILSVRHTLPAPGAIAIFVEYENLVTGQRQKLQFNR